MRLKDMHFQKIFLQMKYRVLFLNQYTFPSGSDGKESACNAADPGSIPGSGRSPGKGNGSPLHHSCLEICMAEEPGGLQSMGSLRDTTEWLTLSLSFIY